MPSVDQLQDYYNGFMFNADIRYLSTILLRAPGLFSQIGLPKTGSLRMLDVGGGGGFYAKAFEMLGYGESTYIDLDKEACVFAEFQVGLRNVLNQDAALLSCHSDKFDFIMCRHLIEHLTKPTEFIMKLIRMLTARGILILICPNGDSLEYFAYPGSNLKKRIQKIALASRLSRVKVIAKLLSGEMLHGIDPPRHLWAVSRNGIQRFLADNHALAEIATFPLSDPIYSPYWSSRTLAQKACSFIGDKIASKISGGTHLSIVIKSSRKSKNENVA
jgi:SAM-dependent methyltransferase